MWGPRGIEGAQAGAREVWAPLPRSSPPPDPHPRLSPMCDFNGVGG